MEAPSAPGHRGQVPWQGLLLAVSLSTFWIPPITAKPTVESVPPDAAEGQDVLLLVRNLPGYFGRYYWYKGRKVDHNQYITSYDVATETVSKGPAHSGREIIYPNASLLFKNVTQEDTGDYTLQYRNRAFDEEKVTGQLRIGTGGDTTDLSTGLSVSVIAAIVIGVLAGVVLAATPGCVLIYQRSGRTSDKRGLTEHQPPVPTPESPSPYYLGIGDYSPLKMDPVSSPTVLTPVSALHWTPSVYTTPSAPQPDTKPDVPIYEELQHPETNIYCWINPKGDVVS